MTKGKEGKKGKKEVVVKSTQITMGQLTKALSNASLKTNLAPVSVGSSLKPYRRMSTNSKGVTVLEACDLIAVVSTPGVATTSGQQLLQMGIAPLSQQFINTSLYYEALRHEKYLFKKLKFFWQPELSSTANAGCIMAYDPDVSDSGPQVKPLTADGQLQVQQVYMGYRDSIKGSLWQEMALDCKVKEDPQKFYYTNYVGGDPRLASQGQLFFAVTGSPILANTILGTIAIEYKIELFDPSVDQINSELRTSQTVTSVLTTNAGFNKLVPANFTTSGGQSQYPLGVDASGNRFISIPPGIHEIVRTQSNTTNATALSVPTYSLVDNIAQAVGGVLTVLDSLTGSAAAATGSTSYLRTKIQAPLGGSKLYSTDGLAVAALSDTLRLAQWAASALI